MSLPLSGHLGTESERNEAEYDGPREGDQNTFLTSSSPVENLTSTVCAVSLHRMDKAERYVGQSPSPRSTKWGSARWGRSSTLCTDADPTGNCDTYLFYSMLLALTPVISRLVASNSCTSPRCASGTPASRMDENE